MKKVAIQGTLGSYHDIAAHKYFEGEEIQLICCASFEDVFAAVKQEACCTTMNSCAKAAHRL